MMKLLRILLVLLIVGLSAFWFVTRPRGLPADAMADLSGDPGRGETIFWAGGCASCHADPEATGEARLLLGGGQKFASPFGTFIAPNISPHPDNGIGGWTALELANAMTRGISPGGQHYYPVFPYASYIHAELQDVADLHAYLMTLPPVAVESTPHEVGFPFSLRRALGGWKFMFLNTEWVVDGDLTSEQARGRYLVEALGHCGECHTPRNALGGMQRDRWLAGGPVPAGSGRFPNITPAKLTWSEADIAEYLKSGFTPDFDSAGGHMALVVENMAKLTPPDRAAIASYLKIVQAAE